MSLKEAKFLAELSKEMNISTRQLARRINKMIKEGQLIEYQDYKKACGSTGVFILSKTGVEKIIKRGDK